MLQQNISDFEPISDINVTPFVDVLLVLLVIFMITAPLFTKAIDVQLPEEDLRSSEVKDARQFIISIDRKGNLSIRGKRYKLKDVKKISISWSERNQGKTAFIEADKRVRYGKITAVMVALKNSGLQNVGLLIKEKI
ncbi:MAG: protein TolR [Proteobacteria bacterium]|nr:protein TolR [Pseudomonadota bacterium]